MHQVRASCTSLRPVASIQGAVTEHYMWICHGGFYCCSNIVSWINLSVRFMWAYVDVSWWRGLGSRLDRQLGLSNTPLWVVNMIMLIEFYCIQLGALECSNLLEVYYFLCEHVIPWSRLSMRVWTTVWEHDPVTGYYHRSARCGFPQILYPWYFSVHAITGLADISCGTQSWDMSNINISIWRYILIDISGCKNWTRFKWWLVH
jgi:hypothetical protein